MHKTGTADCVVDWAGDELLFIRFSSWLRQQAGIGNLLHSVHAQPALQPAAEAGSPRRMHIRMRDPNARSECAIRMRDPNALPRKGLCFSSRIASAEGQTAGMKGVA